MGLSIERVPSSLLNSAIDDSSICYFLKAYENANNTFGNLQLLNDVFVNRICRVK